MRVGVCIPVKNRLDLTAPLVRSLLEDRGHERLRIYDNGSTDDTPKWCAQVGGLLRVEASDLTLHQMWNHFIEENLDLDALVILNNDLILDGKRHWLQRLCEPVVDGWAALSPNYDKRQHYADVEQVHGICAGRYDGTGGLAGFAFAVDAKVFREGYRFPEEAKWWFGDTDFARTMDESCRPMGIVIGCGVTHINGGSQTAKDYDLSDQCRADMAWYESKWGPVHA